MPNLRQRAALVVFVLASIGSSAAQVPTLRVIRYMLQYQQPIGMTEGSPGVFFTTAGSVTPLVFTIKSQGEITGLATFQSAAFTGLMVAAQNGRFYSGLTVSTAAVFSVDARPGSRVYPSQNMNISLTQGLPDGQLLGVGGEVSYSLLKSDLHGLITQIYAFPASDFLKQDAFVASDWNYYRIAISSPGGYVYRITPAGALTKVTTFTRQSLLFNTPYLPLFEASDGNVYGALPSGGTNSTGAIFKLTLNGDYTLLFSFPKGSEYIPTALIEGSDGSLYGATSGSLLFRITKSGQYTPLHQLNISTEGQCQCLLTQGSDGIIYGSAQAGGIAGAGSYFAFNVGLPKPAPRTQYFRPQTGPVGTRVLLWGSNLLAASVQFGSIPAAAVENAGANYVWATVSAGGVTGPITVTTPGGSVMTHASSPFSENAGFATRDVERNEV